MRKGIICLYTNDIVSDSVQKENYSLHCETDFFLGNPQPLRINFSPWILCRRRTIDSQPSIMYAYTRSLRHVTFWIIKRLQIREEEFHAPMYIIVHRDTIQIAHGTTGLTRVSSGWSTTVIFIRIHDRICRQERSHKSSYWRKCIRWMMSRQSLNTLLMFSVSTAHVKCG